MARFKDLTKKELLHLREIANCTTLRDFRETAAAQKKMRDERLAASMAPGIAEPCFECRAIAIKLGLEV